MGTGRHKQLNVRVSEEEFNRWKEVAGPHQSMASWVREKLNEASEPLPPREVDHENHR